MDTCPWLGERENTFCPKTTKTHNQPKEEEKEKIVEDKRRERADKVNNKALSQILKPASPS